MKDKFCVKKKNVAADCRLFFIQGWGGTGISGNYFYKKLFILQAVD